MDFDQQLNAAFHSQQPCRRSADDLRQRVLIQVWRRRALRGCEVVLSLVALVVFGSALGAEQTPVRVWLIMPFFVVYLPVMWTLILREPPHRSVSPSDCVSRYARQRLQQIRSQLRQIWLASLAANALLIYSALAVPALVLLGIPDTGRAALSVCLYAIAWYIGTALLTRRSRRRLYAEYRSLLRVVGVDKAVQ